ncbi:hypothetical protein SCA6_005186, partial [Theobroma cacao]
MMDVEKTHLNNQNMKTNSSQPRCPVVQITVAYTNPHTPKTTISLKFGVYLEFPGGKIPLRESHQEKAKAVRNVAKTEKDAQVQLKLYDPSEFHVINPTKKTRVGNSVGYKVVPGGTAFSLLDHEDPPQRR